MKKPTIQIPLAFKLVFLTSLLVIAACVVIAWENSKLFQTISTDREESTAKLLVAAKTLEVEAIIESYLEKMTTLIGEERKASLAGELVYLKLETTATNSFELELQNEKLGLGQAEFRQVLEPFKIHLETIQSGNIFIASTGNLLKEPLLVIGTPVGREHGVVSHWAWGLFQLNRLQLSFSKTNTHLVYLLDHQGKVIAHPDEHFTIEARDLSQHPIITQALKEEIRQKQRYFEDNLFSTSKSMYGPLVVGEISKHSIMAPAQLAKETTYFILGIVLSLSFFLSVIFSQTLTKNIELLTHFSRRISTGDFEFQAAAQIRSKDELGVLAHAFDDMTMGLKERDKIKNMFTKFHGTTITDELLNQEDLRRGKQCDAVIFFSDLRGFTDFSNNKSPEEVVMMLNSYFEVMVGIITRHGGVVDKFVGDAIMAVWGAPHMTPDDARNAVIACLEMRQALESFNSQRISEGKVPIMMGMGLHAGPVVAGTVGSNDRLEYTVIGDTVNTASRIESSTKSFGTDLLISEEVCKRVEGQFMITIAGSTKVKGKATPLNLAKVDGYFDENFKPCIIKTPYSSYAAEDSEKVKIVA
jgi:adenylate cyclase